MTPSAGRCSVRGTRGGGNGNCSPRPGRLLADFGLTAHADTYAGQLSGGQRRLTEIMRSLMARPRILLLDEPMAGVNPTLRLTIEEHLKRLRDGGLTMLMVEHELGSVERVCDSVHRHGPGHAAGHGDDEPNCAGTRRSSVRISLGKGSPGGGQRGADAAAAALTITGLAAGYGDSPTIMDVDLTVGGGRSSPCSGPNGAGKSTLLKAVLGHLRPMSGTVLLGGRNLAGLRSDQVCRLSVGYVPQVQDTFPRLTALENIEMGGYTLPEVKGQGAGSKRCWSSTRSCAGWLAVRAVTCLAASARWSPSPGR